MSAPNAAPSRRDAETTRPPRFRAAGRRRAWAKLNPFLEVLGRRADGYHDLDTVMVEVALADTLAFSVASAGPAGSGGGAAPACAVALEGWDAVRPGGGAAPGAADNLVARAFAAFHRATGRGRPTRAALTKRIPAGAGLGGGSSDAAATLCWANARFGGGLDDTALARLAAGLGADVPFFVRGGWARCGGIGDRVAPLAPPPGAAWRFWIFAPPWTVDTPAAYRALDDLAGKPARRGRGGAAPWPDRRSAGPFLDAMAAGDRAAAGAASFNRFEEAMARVAPGQAAFMDALGALGARPPRLTGSGAAVWAFDESPAGDRGPDHPDEEAAAWRARLDRAGWPGVRVFRVAAVDRAAVPPPPPAA